MPISEQDKIPNKEIIDQCELPDRCKWLKKDQARTEETITCNGLNSTFNTNKCNISSEINNEKSNFYIINLVLLLKYKQDYVLNNGFNMHEIIEYAKPLAQLYIKFIELKGFRFDLALQIENNKTYFEFYDMEFGIFNQQGDLIRNCREYKKAIGNLTRGFIKKDSHNFINVNFINTQFRNSLCALQLKNAKIGILKLNYLVNSYYKRNVINFLDDDIDNNGSLNSEIFRYVVDNFYGLDLDWKLINRDIFKKSKEFHFDGVINSIQNDVFRSFEKLRLIRFNPIFLLNLIRKQGIDWIKSINMGIKSNLTNSEMINNIDMEKSVEIKFVIMNVFDFLYNNKAQLFYDEDFCLFKDFPFEQLIIINVNLMIKQDKLDLSCTTLWLVQYYPIYYKYSKTLIFKSEINQTLQVIKNQSLLKKCDFQTRLSKCNRLNFKITKTNVNVFDFMVISQFLLVIFTPIVCLFGIVTNILIVLTVFDKRNRKELKEKQYTYMAINSITNILILFIQILSLMNECQYPFGIFCSSIRKYPVIQYFKIVFGETVSSFLRLISNFTYLAFSINRLSLVGKNGDFIEYFSKLAVYKYMIFSSVVSALFSLVKGFRFRVNSFEPDELYPFIFYRESDKNNPNYKTIYTILFVFDAVYNFFNYIIFTFIHLISDILLYFKIRNTIKEKEVKFKTIYLLIDSQYTKKLKENRKSIRKVLKMVIFYSFVSLVCKIPISITSLNDLRLLIINPFNNLEINYNRGRELFKFPYSMNSICYLDEICLIFESFGNFLYFISLGVNIFFFCCFDKKFRLSFYTTFDFNVLKAKCKLV